ncbi:hypothetical protein [Vibrio harveyi]|uniref:hypothetical protein n=1 Tax=Vibrio harveyi TaxID=669 RepID=UPI00217F16FC|nr:hypothetical protein [Vibrio harveyi]
MLSVDLDRVMLDCDGVNTRFSFPFKVLSPKDLKVYVIKGESVTELVMTADYNVPGFDWLNGGDVVTNSVYDNLSKIYIVRQPNLLQETSFRNLGAFFPGAHEDAFDRIYMILQNQGYATERALIHDDFDVWDFEGNQSKNVPSPNAGDSVANAAFVLQEIGKAQLDTTYVAPIYWDGTVAAGEYIYPLNGADVEDEKAYRVVLDGIPQRPKKDFLIHVDKDNPTNSSIEFIARR